MKKSRGLALAVVLLLIPVVLVLGFGLTRVGVDSLHHAQAAHYSKRAVFAAEAGISRAMQELGENSAWTTGYTDQEMTNSEDTYTVKVFNNASGAATITADNGAAVPPGMVYLLATGTSREGRTDRAVGVLLVGSGGGPAFPYAIWGEDGIVGNGGHLRTDSYNSNEGSYEDTKQDSGGDLGTNFPSEGDDVSGPGLTLHGTGNEINGAVDVGHLGQAGAPTISAPSGSYNPDAVTVLETPKIFPPILPEQVPNLTAATAPDFAKGDNTLEPDKNYGDVDIQSGRNVTLSPGTYVFHNLDVQAELKVEEGPVIIYITGRLKVFGQGEINNATQAAPNLRFYCSSDVEDVVVTGGSQAAFALYAPSSDISVNGGGDVYGAIIGKSVTMNGGGAVHYDLALNDIDDGGGGGLSEVVLWQRL